MSCFEPSLSFKAAGCCLKVLRRNGGQREGFFGRKSKLPRSFPGTIKKALPQPGISEEKRKKAFDISLHGAISPRIGNRGREFRLAAGGRRAGPLVRNRARKAAWAFRDKRRRVPEPLSMEAVFLRRPRQAVRRPAHRPDGGDHRPGIVCLRRAT